MTISNFLTKLAQADTKTVEKGSTGVRTGSHAGDVYTNKQGRMFGLSSKHNAYLDIELGQVDGVAFIKVTPAQSNGKDEKGKPTYPKTAFKTSEESTGTAFVTVSKLCRELFGDNKEDWARDFKKQGSDNGSDYYTLIEKTEETKVETKSETKATK